MRLQLIDIAMVVAYLVIDGDARLVLYEKKQGKIKKVI